MSEKVKPQPQIPKQSSLAKSQSTSNLLSYTCKLTEAVEINAKLRELLQTMQKNAVYKKIETQQEAQKSCTELQVAKLKKKQGKLVSEIEQLTNNLNVLINQNHKLKLQVDSSRNSRVIYSNVYKTLEKEIRKNEFLYKMVIIEGLAYQEIEGRVKQKVQKTIKKLQKEVTQIEGVVAHKRQKKKSRLDTGLQNLRAHKLGTKETNRCSSKEDTTHKGIQTKRDEIIGDSSAAKRDGKSSRKVSVAKQPEVNKTQRSIRTRNKIPLGQETNEYFNLQMKSNYYDNVAMHLLKICGDDSLEEVRKYWKNVQNEIQVEFTEYLIAEERVKTLQKEIQQLSNEYDSPTPQQPGAKSAEETQLQETEQQIEKQLRKLNELQSVLSAKMDFNCSKLTNDEITHHILRMKNHNEISSRQLEKLLESVCKEKSGSLMHSRLSQIGR